MTVVYDENKPIYKVVYIQPQMCSESSNISAQKIEGVCNQMAAKGYHLKEAYTDEALDCCGCETKKTTVLIFSCD